MKDLYSYSRKPHGTTWKHIYGLLREKLVNRHVLMNDGVIGLISKADIARCSMPDVNLNIYHEST